jgi:hypothetical protein
VKDYSIYFESAGKFEVGYSSVRNRQEVGQWQSGWRESGKSLLQKFKQWMMVTQS